MKPITTALLILGLTATANAAEVGLGFGINNGANTLFVPVKLANGMILEGFGQYRNWSDTYQYGSVSHSSGHRETAIGMGIFWTKAIHPGSNFYAGPRISYLRTTHDWNPGGNVSNGYQVAPTLGVEFFPVKHLSIGGEVGLAYSHTTGSQTYPESSDTTMRGKGLATVSSIILRAYF